MKKRLVIFDIGGTTVKYATVDSEGNIENKGSFNTPWEDLSQMITLIEERCQKFINKYEIVGISISSAGMVRKRERIIGEGSKFYQEFGREIVSKLENKFKVPVSVENDANCAALAEKWVGNAINENDFITIVLGTAIGGAIMVNGKLWRGAHNLAGEFGFALDCKGNGEYQLWSTGNSTIGMARNYSERKGLSSAISGEAIVEAYDDGDEDAIIVYDDFCKHIARRIYELQYYFDPNLILLGGGISSANGFLEKINQYVDKISKSLHQTIITPKVDVCQFGNDANILGATYGWISENGALK